jgi:hypothetical protein
MPISLSCPQCGKLYQLSDGLAGKKGRCKDCGTIFEIPASRGAAPPPPPVDLFAGLDDGEPVARPASTRSTPTKFGTLPTDTDDPAPVRRPSKPKRRAEVDHGAQESFRKSGISMILFGGLACGMPMVGLQWRLLAFIPPAFQIVIGGGVLLLGLGTLAVSFMPRPSKAMTILGGFIILAVVGMILAAQSGKNGNLPDNPPPPAFAGLPNQPPPMMPRPFTPPPFTPPPANPTLPQPSIADSSPPPADEALFTLSNAQAARESGPGVMIRELTFRVDYQSTGKTIMGPPQFFWVIESARTNAGRRMTGVNMQSGTLSGSITVTDGDTGPFKTYLARESFGPGGRQRAKVSNVVDMQWMGERAANESMIPNGPAQQPTTNPPPGLRPGFPNLPGRPGFPRRPGMR